MKRIVMLFLSLAWMPAVFAQTPEEIVSRMEEAMKAHEKEGLIMVVDLKIPIVGTVSSKTYTLDKKARIDADAAGVQIVTWVSEDAVWVYNDKTGEVEIRKNDSRSSSQEGDAEMFSDITEGYDVSLAKETADAWFILCKKSKTNKEKDDPKTMDLVVSKGNYYPKSLSAKLSGVTMTMRDISFGVTEKQVTFNPADYPDAKIVDKR